MLKCGDAQRQIDVSTTPVGYWKTIDDKTHQARSIVRIVEINGELRGTIVKLLAPPKDDPDPICEKCTGNKKNKSVRGLEFLWGFKREARGGATANPKGPLLSIHGALSYWVIHIT